MVAKKENMVRYGLRLPQELIDKLEAIRTKTGAPVNELIRRAVEYWLKEGRER